MCYAIPGRVIEIKGNIISVDYFGETRRARNDFYELYCGDYVYAQGGIVVQKIPEIEATSILQGWKELFFKLKQTDAEIALTPKNIFQRANAIRQKESGNACCVHGILEFSNFCQNDCFYCGIRKSNIKISRYRMEINEIIKAAEYAVKELNFKALVLQSGEDLWYDAEKLTYIIRKIMRESPALLILSIGERQIEVYQRLYEAGCRGALLRFETSNPSLYERYRPWHKLNDRLNLIKELRRIGYLIFSGFLIGLPDATESDLLNDIELTGELNADMFSFGPFIPHPDTPLKDSPKPSIETVLDAIARARIMEPQAKILATTALETLDKENGLRLGLISGANSMMINITPRIYSRFYELYPNRTGPGVDITTRINNVINLLRSIGRLPTDLGL